MNKNFEVVCDTYYNLLNDGKLEGKIICNSIFEKKLIENFKELFESELNINNELKKGLSYIFVNNMYATENASLLNNHITKIIITYNGIELDTLYFMYIYEIGYFLIGANDN